MKKERVQCIANQFVTPVNLAAWLPKWQHILRLRDWNVVAHVVPKSEVPDCRGDVEHSVGTKSAMIRIGDNLTVGEAAEVLVHELLHLHFAPFEAKVNGSAEDIAQEQAIQLIAEALVSQRRL